MPFCRCEYDYLGQDRGQRSMSAMSTELLKLFYNVDDFAPNQNEYISLSTANKPLNA